MKIIRAHQVDIETIEKRKKRIFLNKKNNFLLGSPLLFPIIFNHHLNKIKNGFSLYPLHAQKYFNKKLIKTIPIEKITHFMHDWVKTDEPIIHTSDYFISNQDLLSLSTEINRLSIYRTLKELIEKNWRHRETKIFQIYLNALNNGKPIKKQQNLLDSESAIDGYFHRFHTLYESIQNNGFLSNASLGLLTPQHKDREIGIAIGAHGEIIKLQGGQHRFSIAKLLHIPEIPVEVRMIHKDLILDVSKKRQISPCQAVRFIAENLSNIQEICAAT